MVNEKLDLIDRKALLAEYDRVHIGPPGGARTLMEDAPTVDAVEVVRCHQCIHHSQGGLPDDRVWCRKMCRYMDADEFCSRGEGE